MPCKEGYNIYFPFFPASKTCFKFFTGSTFLLSKKEQKQTIIISEREKGKRIQPHHCWRAAPMRARANSDHFCARAQIKQLSFFRRTIWRSRARAAGIGIGCQMNESRFDQNTFFPICSRLTSWRNAPVTAKYVNFDFNKFSKDFVHVEPVEAGGKPLLPTLLITRMNCKEKSSFSSSIQEMRDEKFSYSWGRIKISFTVLISRRTKCRNF